MMTVAASSESFSLLFKHFRIAPYNKTQPMVCYHTLKICCILQGNAVWTIGRKSYDIAKGDIVIFNNTEYRAIHTVAEPDDLIMITFEFEPRFIWSGLDSSLDVNFLRVFFERDSNFENKIDAKELVSQEVEGILWQIFSELRDKKTDYLLMVKAKLLNILVCLNRYYDNSLTSSDSLKSVPVQHLEHMNDVLNYIEEHISSAISLEKISGIIHMNPSYFSRIFKKYNGLGFMQYITKRRIQKSIQYLRETDLPVLEIASLCGFNNTSNFYKAFKSVTGSIPSEFRNA